VSADLGTIPWMQAVPDNAWGRLALHLASDHADPLAVCRGARQNDEQHEHEHDGPGTIRNHPRDSRHFELAKARAVILEALTADWEEPGEGL
jgi:hypothetical protein